MRINFISDRSVAVEGTYKETWKYIGKDKNSLQCHSNMHLIFKTDYTEHTLERTEGESKCRKREKSEFMKNSKNLFLQG